MPRWRCKGALAGLALTACAGNPSLPIAQIDRPYTLPADTREFALGATYAALRNTAHPPYAQHVNPDSELRIPLGDTWTWENIFALSHQFTHTGTDTLGALAGVGTLGYSSVDGFWVGPLAQLFYRRQFSPRFALEDTVGVEYQPNRTDGRYLRGWSAFWKVAPLFQLDASKSLSPSVTAAWKRRLDEGQEEWDDVQPAARPVVAFPVALAFAWRLSQGWELRARYEYQSWGYTDGYDAHLAGLSFARYW